MTGSSASHSKWLNLDWTETGSLDACEHQSPENLIAIGGCARSGTTLLRVILDSHPEVVVGPPTNIFIPTPLDLSDIAFRLALDETRLAQKINQCTDRVKFIELVAAEAKEVYNKRVWGDKTARNVHRFGWILEHFPNAHVIHVIRDGRDVICSLRTHRRREVIDGQLFPTTTRVPLGLCSARWVNAVETGISYRGNHRYHEVRYEDLVFRPWATVVRVCEFLGLKFDPAMLSFHLFGGPLREPRRFPQNVEATRPLYRTAVGRWRRDLSETDTMDITRELSPLLSELGYDDAC